MPIPDPAGSPLEKLVVARRTPSPKDFASYLRQEGVDPDTADRIGRAVQQWESEKHFDEVQALIDMEHWANTHTHTGGGGGGVDIPLGILVGCGGEGPSGALDSTYKYNFNLDSWETMATMLQARYQHGFSRGGDSLLYAFGGINSSGSKITSMEVYDRDLDTWTAKSSMGTARAPLGVSYLGGFIYALGGDSGGTTAERYEVSSDSWSSIADLPSVRSTFQPGCAAANGVVYMVGGSTNSTPTGDLYAYDVTSDAWVQLTSMPTARSFLAASVDPSTGLIYAAGGFASEYKTTVECYDPSSDTWTTVSSMTIPRGRFSLAWAEGKMYTLTGINIGGSIDSVERYDPDLDTWENVANYPVAAQAAGLAS